MREIKFRAYHSEHKAYCEGKTSNMFQWIEEGQPIELEQFTGLKDKNRVDIYEGDMTSLGEIVVFKNGSFITTYRGDTQNGMLLSEKRCKYLEIEGNIHD